MARWGRKTPSRVQWPAEWSEEEGWPSTNGEEVGLKAELRTWAHLSSKCLGRSLGIRASNLIEGLGGPPGHDLERTFRQCHEVILPYFNKDGIRPTCKTSPEFRNMDSWLRRQGSSLSRECDELKLPVLRKSSGRTVKQCHKEIRSHYKETGKRPTEKSSREFQNWNNWLRRRGSSLPKECVKLGFLGPVLDRTLGQGHSVIRSYYKELHIRPTKRTSEEFRRWDHWFTNRGSSLSQECDKLGLPRSPNAP